MVQNAVNLPSLSHEEYVQLAPYIDLAGRLGAFLSQTGKGGIEAVQIFYSGLLTEAKTDLVRNSAIAGMLQGLGEREPHQRRRGRGGARHSRA